MLDPRLSLAERLLQEDDPSRHKQRGRKVVAHLFSHLFSMLTGFGFAMFFFGREQLTVQGPDINMAVRYMQPTGIGQFLQRAKPSQFLQPMRSQQSMQFSRHAKSVQPTRASTEVELASSAFDSGREFVSAQSLNSLAPVETVTTIVEDLQSNNGLWDEYKGKYDEYLVSLEERLRKEDRSIKELIGESSMQKILTQVEKQQFDKSIVTTFMTQPAVEQILSDILYEGIFEFTQKVDIIGNVVNGLPIIGPIRQQVVTEFKKALDRILGPQIKTFLASYNRVAVQRVIDLVVSPENAKAFSTANAKIVSTIFDRKLNSLVPDEKTSADLRESFWDYIRDVSPDTINTAVRTFYEEFGEREFSSVADVADIMEKSTPQLKGLIVSIIEKFLSSPQGAAFLAEARKT